MTDNDGDNSVMQIDVGKVLASRAPRLSRWLPRFVVRWLERLICQDDLNAMLRAIGARRGVEAAETVLQQLDITLVVHGMERLTDGERYMFMSNHPLGGLDGLALIAVVGRHYDGEIRFLVNDLLMAVEPLRDIFLPVNKFGQQSREAVVAIARASRSDLQLLTFPAGLCSRLQDDGSIADLEWHKAAVALAERDSRRVVPVYFDGHNSRQFYRIARWRKRLGVRFNFEQVLLPREVFKNRNATFHIHIGTPVTCDELGDGNAATRTEQVRRAAYALADEKSGTTVTITQEQLSRNLSMKNNDNQ